MCTSIYLYKGARIGYTKMLLAAMFYLIQHKRCNVGFWREDDKAIEKFVATELDFYALRDCKALHPIFPSVGKKGPGNTVNLKTFIGATLRCQGGQSAGNYRGDSVDVAIGDEINAFVSNLQGKSGKEGSPWPLMFKRTNGSAWPKKILGTTPTKVGESRHRAAGQEGQSPPAVPSALPPLRGRTAPGMDQQGGQPRVQVG